jgi:hypothetical protein
MATLADRLTSRLARAEARLTLYVAAETAILQGAQSYSIGNRTLSRADLGRIASEIQRLETEILQLDRGGAIRIQRVVPRDV